MAATQGIPTGITREHILAAIADLDAGASHDFGPSTGYDLFYEGNRYPPKAVVGLASGKLTGVRLGPYDFKGGLNTLCFRVLQQNRFQIILKADHQSFPGEVDSQEQHTEGAVTKILVNRYERDAKARAKAISYYGRTCQVCSFDFALSFGEIGSGFIHVHHIIPLSDVQSKYTVDPIKDLRPVCPNCHAMLHRRTPPYDIKELRLILRSARSRT